MFKHIYLNRIKCLLRNKSLMFWTLLFPIILGTLFNFAFANLKEELDPIDVVVIENEAYKSNTSFKKLIEELSKEGNNKLLNVTHIDENNFDMKEVYKKLEENEFKGIIEVKEDIKLIISSSGLNQTILKSILDNYKQTYAVINTIAMENPRAINEELINSLSNKENYIKDNTSSNTDATVIYFYTLIGMAVIYAGFWGVRTITETQANLSSKGKRLSISPVNKLYSLIASLAAGFTIHIVELLILLGYLTLILNKDFGNNMPYVILICIVGSIAGIALGSLFAATNNLKEDTKVGIYSTFSLVLSFLSGMMYIDMKYIIAKNVPILAKINPVALITDGLYSLYYYDTYTRFFENIIYLAIISVVLVFLTYLLVRRHKYESL